MLAADPSFAEQFFSNFADHTALSSFTAEASLLAGTNRQAVIPKGFFGKQGKTIRIQASGIVSSTGTPTFLFTNRLGATIASTYLSGTAVGISAAITTGSGISNARWDMELLLTCRTPGQGSGNTTLSCTGWVASAGFASPFHYTLTPGGGESATWTTTLDNSVDLYPNLSCTCGTSNAANTITCKDYKVTAEN